MWQCIYQLESEKFDLTEKMKRQKYEVGALLPQYEQDYISAHGEVSPFTIVTFFPPPIANSRSPSC